MVAMDVVRNGSNSSPGFSVVFLASALWMRGRPYTIIGPIFVICCGIILGLGKFDFNLVMIGLNIQTEKNQFWATVILFCIALGYFSSLLIIDDFDVNVVEKGDIFNPTYDRLGFLVGANPYWS